MHMVVQQELRHVAEGGRREKQNVSHGCPCPMKRRGQKAETELLRQKSAMRECVRQCTRGELLTGRNICQRLAGRNRGIHRRQATDPDSRDIGLTT